ncbi:MAG: ACP S-malonyltransferase [Acutalibacteraceae bacterium]|nr:ACP S-malonyltransferase [Acutalibacteraceae bacterium]
MGKIAFMFSGQGAQFIGMGKDLYDNVPCVKDLFDKAEEMRKGTLNLMFSGDEAELKQTVNTQPCMYLADLGAARALESMGVKPDAVAGFSLGEIAALAYSGAYSDEEGFSLVCKRGEAMGKAAEKHPAMMAAIIKLSNEKVEELCEKAGAYPVNYNSPGQLVVSGTAEAIAKISELAKEEKGRALPLKVSGGFHSPFMDEAAEEFGEVLKTADIKEPSITSYSNYTAKPYEGDVKDKLKNQINHPVKWSDIILDMVDNGFDTFIETGCGNTLKKLVEKIAPECKTYAVSTKEEAEIVVKELIVNA